jgi:hypothetical protein
MSSTSGLRAMVTPRANPIISPQYPAMVPVSVRRAMFGQIG